MSRTRLAVALAAFVLAAAPVGAAFADPPDPCHDLCSFCNTPPHCFCLDYQPALGPVLHICPYAAAD